MLSFIENFILGMLIGYELGLLHIHQISLQSLHSRQLPDWWLQLSSFFMQMIWMPVSNWFNSFSPSLSFASDVIAYQAAIIAIAIPLSLDIIARISERYQSGVITKQFNRQWQLKALLILVITDAVLGVTLKFFVETKVDGAWKFIAWLIFIIFIVTNIVLFAFFNVLRQYATKTKFLLDRLFDDLNEVLRIATVRESINDKQLKAEHEKFINALEGIGDILVFETKNRKNSQNVIQRINQIQNYAQDFFAIQEKQPEIFPKLLYSHELLQLHEENQQRAYLETRVIIRIYEKFSLEIDPGFVGFIIP